jgi:C-terminal processing protease CtpA/Prc
VAPPATSGVASQPPPRSAKDLAQEGRDAYGRKDYARSADLFDEAIARGVDDPVVVYDAACSSALAGRKDRAFELLARAVETGGVGGDHLAQDSDLTSLHDDVRWQAALAAVAQRERAHNGLWDSPALATPFRESLPEDERVAGLSKLWSEAKYNFVDTARLAAIDWDGQYLRFLPRVRATASTYAYYRLLQEFCAKLEDAHTNVFFPDDLERQFLGKPGLHTRLVDGKVLIVDVWDPELRAQGVERGMEIVRIDGLAAHEYAERKVAPTQSVATPQDRDVRLYEYALLRGPLREPLQLSLQSADGKVLERRVLRKSSSARKAFMPGLPAFERRTLAGNVAYVALNEFEDSDAADGFLKAFDDVVKAAALVIDVRENGGGSSDEGYRVVATLVDEPFATSNWATRDYKPSYRAWGMGERMYGEPADRRQPDAGHRYPSDKPIVVLASARTFSAAEDFLVAFDQTHRGVIVGEPSGGSTGMPLFFRLPGGGSARVCTKRDTYADGKAFVGVGVVPQIAVHPTVADVRAGRDAVLEAALAYLMARRPAEVP